MGLISNLPIYQGMVNTLNNEDFKDPQKFLDKTISTFKVSRRFSVDPHNKKHLFGKTDEKPVEPSKQQLYEYLF